MVTSISVALCNVIRRIRLLETTTAISWVPGSISKTQHAAGPPGMSCRRCRLTRKF